MAVPHGALSGPIQTAKLALCPVETAVTCNCKTVSAIAAAALPSPLRVNRVGAAVGVVDVLLHAKVAATAANTASHFRVVCIHHCDAVSDPGGVALSILRVT